MTSSDSEPGMGLVVFRKTEFGRYFRQLELVAGTGGVATDALPISLEITFRMFQFEDMPARFLHIEEEGGFIEFGITGKNIVGQKKFAEIVENGFFALPFSRIRKMGSVALGVGIETLADAGGDVGGDGLGGGMTQPTASTDYLDVIVVAANVEVSYSHTNRIASKKIL